MPIRPRPDTAAARGRLVEELTTALRAGSVVVLPTDTVYGVAVVAADADALDALRDVKGRPAHVPVAVLVADAAQGLALADGADGVARRLADRFWPGPLTLVVRAAPGAPDVGGEGTIGVRCPDDDLVRALAARVGPLAASSANRHGEDTPTTAAGCVEALGDLLVVDGGELAGAASTVVDVTGAVPEVLRAGPVDATALAAALDGA